MRNVQPILAVPLLACAALALSVEPRDEPPGGAWRKLPLIADGKVDPHWAQIGWGGFAVDGDSLRTECDERGMGLLLYTKERFGDCQVRVVYRSKDARSNAGVFVRIDDGILKRVHEKTAAARRNADGSLADGEQEVMKEASEKLVGPWYAVHRGYEVQICDQGDAYHRTGAVYSLAKAAPAPPKPVADWKTMVITLKGNLVLVDIDGQRVTTFDPDGKDVPPPQAVVRAEAGAEAAQGRLHRPAES